MLDVTTAAQIVLPQQLANQINQHFRSDAITQFGNEAVLEALLPQLYGKASIKNPDRWRKSIITCSKKPESYTAAYVASA